MKAQRKVWTAEEIKEKLPTFRCNTAVVRQATAGKRFCRAADVQFSSCPISGVGEFARVRTPKAIIGLGLPEYFLVPWDEIANSMTAFKIIDLGYIFC